MVMPNIRVSNFEGPFDLLLHLIKKNKMNINDISIFEITNQYLEYLNEMKELDLDITSEFIVMAATLLEIKSRTLLPKPKIEEESEEDMTLKLMEKLIEYKKFKQVANYLREKTIYTGEVYTKKPEIIEDIKKECSNEDLLKNFSMLQLYNLYNELIERYRNKKNYDNVIEKRIYVDKYKIEDKIKYIYENITEGNFYEFSSFVNQCECKMEVVVTFLALLEMIKQRMVRVVQQGNFEEIIVERMEVNEY